MEMTGRPTCYCPVCELECALLSELSDAASQDQYKTIASENQILSTFPTSNELLSHFREPQETDVDMSRSDDILGELLRVNHDPRLPIGRHLILLIMMPAIHKTSSQIAFGFPSLTRDDIAQHILTSVLDIVSSDGLRTQTSHFAFSITRAMRRHAFRWAIREADLALPSNIEAETLNELPAAPSPGFESAILLAEFLGRCLSNGLLSPLEHELLVLFKIQGLSSEVLAARQHISDVAFRHRMQRVIEKLRRAARAPSTSRQPPNAAVA
jgi:DNA-directed RNA polymerase specialized sigma24 family protein